MTRVSYRYVESCRCYRLQTAAGVKIGDFETLADLIAYVRRHPRYTLVGV